MLEYNKIPEGLSTPFEILAKLEGKSEAELTAEAGKRLKRLQEIATEISKLQG